MRARFSAVVMGAAALGMWAGTAPASGAVGEIPAAAHPSHSLRGISCTGPKNCMAVGVDNGGDHGNGAALAESWNGARWKVSAVRQPPASGVVGSSLSGVSCVSAKSCVAVGYYFYSLPDQDTRNVAFAEIWNGTAWRFVRLAQAASAGAFPNAVSCVAVKSCVAVGEMLLPGKQVAFAQTWNGAAWKMTKVPEPANTISNLSDVSCTAPKSCVAVDAYNPKTLVQSWNGTTWRPGKVPLPASTGPSLVGVSCLTAKFCVATGTHYANPTHFTAIVLFWNGSVWKSAAVPSPGAGYADLVSVSCATAKSCLAVGQYHFGPYENSGNEYAATWNAKAWKLVKVPTPPGGGPGKGSSLTSVKCLSVTYCVAVGSTGVPGTNTVTSYSAFWNGRGWKLIAFP